VYVGPGDEHENKYDSLVFHDSIADLVAELFLTETSRYLGVPLQNEICPYTISLYPSKDYQEKLTSKKPIYFSVAVLLIFGFVTLVFVVYGKYRTYVW
jgi:hypothetical protein